jgi:NADPH:quinone reductase-like Zn-dependent oxidoreductase
MRAVVVHEFGAPEVLKVEQVPTPVIGEDEVLVRNHAAGVNRYDVELRSGFYGGQPIRELFFAKDLKFPLVLGVEPAGEIVEVGAGVPDSVTVGARVTMHTHASCGVCEHCKAGADNACPQIRVFGSGVLRYEGAYAEFFKCDYRRLIPLADNVSYEQGAALQANYGPVLSGLQRAQIEPGETVLVIGAAGGGGVAAVQIAKLLGARVIATAGTDAKARRLKNEIGADDVINYRETSIPEAIHEMTGGRGADIVFELVGAPTWAASLASAGSRGRVIVIGSHGGSRADTNLGELFAKNLSVYGITRANRRNMDRLYQLCADGKIKPIITTFPLEDAVSAHEVLERGEQFGKLVLTM